MKIICSRCKKILGEQKPFDDSSEIKAKCIDCINKEKKGALEALRAKSMPEQGKAREVVFENGLKGLLSVAGSETENLYFFEMAVAGEKFFCSNDSRENFKRYLESINGDEIDITFLHSSVMKMPESLKGRRKKNQTPPAEEKKPEGINYNCTVRGSKQFAQSVFDDMAVRAHEFVQLSADMARNAYKRERHKREGRKYAMRKLASIQRIKALDPIAGADAIERATVLGWQLVVKKGEFKVDELCVYCEVDCLMPDDPKFEFLKPRGMRIKTVRLRGQISQGICFPLSILPGGFDIQEDADCASVLGITKYEPPIPACLSGIAKGAFPSFIPKTDEPRVQILQDLLNRYQGEVCFVSEKVDGSSATFYIHNKEFGVCTRNLELVEDPENTIWKIARELDIEKKLRTMGMNIAIQGEVIGEGVQGNPLKLRGQSIKFFNVVDIDRHEYLSFKKFKQVMRDLTLESVPIIAVDYKLGNDINALVKMATRKSLICPDVWAEGVVIRPLIECVDHTIGRVSFKAVNPEFLLKTGQ